MVAETIQAKHHVGVKTHLGRQESSMLAYLQLRQQHTVRTGELTGPLQLTPTPERELFCRMLRGKLMLRLVWFGPVTTEPAS